MKAVRLILCSAVMVLGIYYIWSRGHSSLSPLDFTYSCDAQLSDATQKNIFEWCQQTITPTNHHLALKEASNLFPYIETITSTRTSKRSYLLSIIAKKPISLLNEQQLLCSDGTVCQRDWYQPSCCISLPKILRGPAAGADHPACAHWIARQPATLFDDYVVTWITARAILFKNKKNDIQFLGATDTLPTERLNAYAKAIEIAHQPLQKKKCLVDIRFRNQIIVQRLY